MDVIEIDAASNRGIDQIRELRDMVRYAATGGHHKVIILDEAHMLTDEASNALLKTLEEPPDRRDFRDGYYRAGQTFRNNSFTLAAFSFPRAFVRGNKWRACWKSQKKKD